MNECSLPSPFTNFLPLIEADDLASVRDWIREHPDALAQVSPEPATSPVPLRPLAKVRSPEMVDLLVESGFNADRISAAWAPGFGLQEIPAPVAERWIARGATVSPHAAAALGLMRKLRDLLDEDSTRVHALGGDGCRPLHFARNRDVAALLLERGADVDARDEDHASTPAQWRIGDAPEVTRLLLDRGATPDVFMAAGLGELGLAERMVDENPACTGFRIGNNSGPFPGIGFQARGGTIYQWTLGFNQSPQEIAHRRGHVAVFDFLMSQTAARPKFLIACALADRVLAEQVLGADPGLLAQLEGEDLALMAKFCWETNLDPQAVRLMLDLGFPVDAPESNHGFKPLHNAAWCGHADLVELLLCRGHPINDPDPTHQGTPLDWAIHSCVEARRHPEGQFARVLELLLQAGATGAQKRYPTGQNDLDAVLQRFGAG